MYRERILKQNSSSPATKRKGEQIGLHEIEMLPNNERNGL
jgi:hypothetical protein